MTVHVLHTPLQREEVRQLNAGDRVLLSGVIYTARDAAHMRMVASLERGEPLPFPLEGQVIYYTGPCPAPPGKPIGSAGPTTSSRMDVFTPLLLSQGLVATIGKGTRAEAVIEAMRKWGAVYLAALGGAGVLLARCVESREVVAYPELGPEAVYRLVVRDFPAVVAIDCRGNNLYAQGPAQYRRQQCG